MTGDAFVSRKKAPSDELYELIDELLLGKAVDGLLVEVLNEMISLGDSGGVGSLGDKTAGDEKEESREGG
jgi:hypothetical protein